MEKGGFLPPRGLDLDQKHRARWDVTPFTKIEKVAMAESQSQSLAKSVELFEMYRYPKFSLSPQTERERMKVGINMCSFPPIVHSHIC